MFTLSTLLNYDNIVIQCHNNPDADTIASGFAVYSYLKSHGKNARMIYSGNAEITKANLLEMVDSLSIPIKYVRPKSGELRIAFAQETIIVVFAMVVKTLIYIADVVNK
jgi:nanoRNase/pAp phosphatase (c-di-AMP/oligoRNAs hydrolase)